MATKFAIEAASRGSTGERERVSKIENWERRAREWRRHHSNGYTQHSSSSYVPYFMTSKITRALQRVRKNLFSVKRKWECYICTYFFVHFPLD
jgi:hypothetical protein